MKYFFLFAIVSVTVVGMYSCKNTPPVITDENGVIQPDVGEGKVIYMRDCARCHEEKKVENFTSAQWANILPRMIIQAQLNDTESRQVKAYVEWELEND